jgi:hypothetical protein
VIATDWLLVTVTICGGLWVPTVNEPKSRLAGNTVTKLPLRLTVCGLPAALSLTASAPLRKPPPVGVKVTDMVQFLPAAKVALQLLVQAKSPVVVMLAILSEALPVLLRMTGIAELVVPAAWDPKFRLVTESEATGVGVGVGVRVSVAVGVAVRVAVAVAVVVRVAVAVAVGVAVAVAVDVAVAVSVAVTVAVAVWVAVGVTVAVEVAVAVAVAVGVAVTVAVAVVVTVAVAVGVPSSENRACQAVCAPSRH